jgi:hypothetical protein
MELHHAPVTFGLIVGEGNAWIVVEAQRVTLAQCQMQEQDVSVAARRAAARLWRSASIFSARYFVRATVEQRTLTPLLLVRIQVPQPGILLKSLRICSFLARRKSLETSAR